MKKATLLIIMFLMFTGVVSASSLNGAFKGNPIVKVLSDGKELKVEGTPGIIYNGNTLIPINMLRQLGAEVTWDQKTYSVNIQRLNIQEKIHEIIDYMDKLHGDSVILTKQNGKYHAAINYFGLSGLDGDWFDIYNQFMNFSHNGFDYIRVNYFLNNEVQATIDIDNQSLLDYAENKIDMETLQNRFKIKYSPE